MKSERLIFEEATEQEYQMSRCAQSLIFCRNGVVLTILILLITFPIEIFLLEKLTDKAFAIQIHIVSCLAIGLLGCLTFLSYFEKHIEYIILVGTAIYTANMSVYFSLYEEYGAFNFAFAQILGIFMFGLIAPNMAILFRCLLIAFFLPIMLASVFSLEYLLIFDAFYFMAMAAAVSCAMTYLNDSKMRLNFQLRRELESDKDRMKELAIRDPLTGCYNRRHFMEISIEEFRRAKRFSHPLTILMIDIDHFKRINDKYGHSVGDEAICSVVDVCLGAIRDFDTLSRFGGEEFIVLLPETDTERARYVAERIRMQISEICVKADNNDVLSITVCVGVSALIEADNDIESVVHRADYALYQAKDAGRNRVSLH